MGANQYRIIERWARARMGRDQTREIRLSGSVAKLIAERAVPVRHLHRRHQHWLRSRFSLKRDDSVLARSLSLKSGTPPNKSLVSAVQNLK